MVPNGYTLSSHRAQYTIVEELSSAAPRASFRATRQCDGAEVVLDLVKLGWATSWEAVSLFDRQSERLFGLDHPSVPTLLDGFKFGIGEIPDCFVLVRELVVGQTLREHIAVRRVWQGAEISAWLCTMLETLGYLHGAPNGLCHGRISPDAIILDSGGAPHLIDFGTIDATFVRELGLGPVSPEGLRYSPPECIHGEVSVSGDLYALAMTALATVTSRSPDALPRYGVRVDVQRSIEGCGLSRGLRSVLEWMTEPIAKRRPRSALDVLMRLRGSSGQNNASAARSSPARGQQRLQLHDLPDVALWNSGTLDLDVESSMQTKPASPLPKPKAKRERRKLELSEIPDAELHGATTLTVNNRAEAVTSRLRELGLDKESYSRLYLLPLIEIVWADGRVKQSERDAVVMAAHALGIRTLGPARKWLDKRPSQQVFDTGLELLCELAHDSDFPSIKPRQLNALPELGSNVATAAGKSIFAALSRREKKVLARLENVLTTVTAS